jgi:hypothetical protein
MSQEPTVSARLGPPERQAALARMAEEVFDVVVVGGVTGSARRWTPPPVGCRSPWWRESTSRLGRQVGPAS